MPELIAKSIAYLLYAYAAVGTLFSALFVCFGVQRLDHQAKDAGWGFRLIVFPGALVLWPLLARRWATGSMEPPTQKDGHR